MHQEIKAILHRVCDQGIGCSNLVDRVAWRIRKVAGNRFTVKEVEGELLANLKTRPSPVGPVLVGWALKRR